MMALVAAAAAVSSSFAANALLMTVSMINIIKLIGQVAR